MGPSLARAARWLGLAAPAAIAITGLIPPAGAAPAQAQPAQASGPLAPGPLAGSQWQLVAIQSMEDATGRRVPPDPDRYTLIFGADGTARLQVDCNRGRAPWQASPAEPVAGHPRQEVSGSLRFGPLELTRALCPPPSLAASLERQLPFVRSYLLKGERLFLSLMADGGILEWKPLQGIPFSSDLGRDGRAAILRGLAPSSRQAVAQAPGTNRAVVARVDLNGDGQPELLAYLMGPYFCGTGGCTLQLLTPGVGGWRHVQTWPITRLPLLVAPTTSQGWRDIWRAESGGGAPSSVVRERFDGHRYRPAERRPPLPSPAGTRVFVGDPGLEDGASL